MQHSTVTAKGQTTLPKPVRDALGLRPGDKVTYIVQDGEVRLTKAKSVKDLFGILRAYAPEQPMSIEDMNDGIAAAVAERNLPR